MAIFNSFLYAYLWGYSLISWRGSIEMTPQHIPLTRGKSTNDGRGIIPSFTSQVCYSFTDHSLHRATMFARDPQFFVRSTSVIIPRRCHFRYRSPFWGGRPLFQLLHARRSRVSSSSRLMLQVRDGIIRIQKSRRWVGGLRCVVLNHLIHSHIIPYLQS